MVAYKRAHGIEFEGVEAKETVGAKERAGKRQANIPVTQILSEQPSAAEPVDSGPLDELMK